MKKLYLCPLKVAQANRGIFHPSGWHGINLPGGVILVATDFVNEEAEEYFRGLPEVEALPDPVFAGTKTMKEAKPKRWKALASIGVVETDTVLDVRKKASKIHPLVKISTI
jgi:hypothetical protein